MMRISERLGMYNYKELDMDAPVYDDIEEMVEAHEEIFGEDLGKPY